MARPRHSFDGILDAARTLVVERGPRRATLASIAEASGAPTGSIYYRFRSIDDLLARLWLRAAQRAQELLRTRLSEDPVQSVVDGALALYDFCLREREDALLLGSLRRSDLLQGELSQEVRSELDRNNSVADEEIRQLARDLFGRADRSAVDLLLLALIDLPYGFARRHIDAGTTPPPARRARLEATVRAVLQNGT